jgi:hypothetical protein
MVEVFENRVLRRTSGTERDETARRMGKNA